MKRIIALTLCVAAAYAGTAAAPGQSTLAESSQPHSNVSLLMEPRLDDGRLVLKMAVKNRTAAPVPFGPTSVTISKPSGEAVALTSLDQLVNDIKVAAATGKAAGDGPTAGAYALRQQPSASDGSGRMDVTGYTGGTAIAPGEQLHWSKRSLDAGAAEAKIAALRQAILQDAMLAPGQVSAGEVVSQKLKFKKGEDRTINVRIRIAGDEHGFTLLAPTI